MNEIRSMARKPSGKEAAATELAEKFLRVLRAQRGLGPESYPLTVGRLVELTDPSCPPALQKKALGKQFFVKEAIRVHARIPTAPIALAVDLDLLAASQPTLEFLLGQARTAKTHAVTPAQIKAKATSKLRKPFQEALTRRIAEESLPPTVGWVRIKGKSQLFLLSDLHTSRGAAPPAAPSPAPVPTIPQRPFAEAFDEAFGQLDRQAGGHNFVSLVSLRQALGVERSRFDEGLRQLRGDGRYTLSAAEGRDGITPEERSAGIIEEGSLLLFVSRSRA